MHGGFSWSSFGSSLSRGFNNLGNFITNTAQRVGSSNAFQQAKTGFLNSGLLENAGQLAGQTLSSLVDIGRLKVENDIDRLRQRVLGTPNQPPLTSDQLAQLLAAINTSPGPVTAAPAVSPVPVTSTAVPTPPLVDVPTTYPTPPPPSMVPQVIPEVVPEVPVALGPLTESTTTRVIARPSRKRRRPSGWGWMLDNITGDGVSYGARRHCY